MIEIYNVIVASVCSFIIGMVVHSAWLHSKNMKHIKQLENVIKTLEADNRGLRIRLVKRRNKKNA